MALGNSLNTAISQLTAAGVGSPRMNAELLLMFTLGCDRAYLYTHPERELTGDEMQRYQDALAQRSQGTPAQYITGHQEFWGLDFIVSPAVLIPRPETEHVIETVLELAKEYPARRIIDVGTGSGCIAIALAKELAQAEIWATDISEQALEVAKANAARHQLESRIQFVRTDLMSGVPGQFDFVVSNPPYVGSSEEDKVQLEVRKFEPRVAVFAGTSGGEVYRRLIPQASQALQPAGWLVMEIGYSQEVLLRALLQNWKGVRFTNDLQGIPRVVAARRS